MDKWLLLVLLCLQVFLVITASSVNHEVAMKENNPRLPVNQVRNEQEAVKARYWLGCWRRPMGCNSFKIPSTTTKGIEAILKKDMPAGLEPLVKPSGPLRPLP